MVSEGDNLLCPDCTLTDVPDCLFCLGAVDWTTALDHNAENGPPRSVNGKIVGRLRYWVFRFKTMIFEITIRYLRRNGKCQK